MCWQHCIQHCGYLFGFGTTCVLILPRASETDANWSCRGYCYWKNLGQALPFWTVGIEGDNHAGTIGTLHRLPVLSESSEKPVGVTLRFNGQTLELAGILTALLLAPSQPKPSVLDLGSSGCVKRTMIRNVTRILTGKLQIVIVDSNDEIRGTGMVPHAPVEDSQRLSMTNWKKKMGSVLLEIEENHSADVVIEDKISNQLAAASAVMARQCGVRLFESAHVDLRGLVKDRVKKHVVGSLEGGVLSDAFSGGSATVKRRSVRAGDGLFEAIFDMGVCDKHISEVDVLFDVKAVIDSCLVEWRMIARWDSAETRDRRCWSKSAVKQESGSPDQWWATDGEGFVCMKR